MNIALSKNLLQYFIENRIQSTVQITVLAIFLSLVPITSSFEHSIYIWQRDWNVYIREAIDEIGGEANHFLVLCGDLRCESMEANICSVPINWSYFDKEKTDLTLVFRINTEASKLMRGDSISLVASRIVDTINNMLVSAARQEMNISGIQFDYDCPTSQLNNYSRFIRTVKREFPNIEISITALPTWMESGDFEGLVKLTSYYVLQVHSFEIPQSIDDALEIFPRDKAYSYCERASGFDHPFYVSLPTYGYEVGFDKDGNFLGLRAEGTPILWRRNVHRKTARTDPRDILCFLRDIKEKRFRNLLGVFWFRLPLKTDEFNWSIVTLTAMMESRDPLLALQVDVVPRERGLFEVYLSNTGEQNISAEVCFNVSWDNNVSLLYDVLGEFKTSTLEGPGRLMIKGPAPVVGERVMSSWFRVLGEQENSSPYPLVTSEVKVIHEDS